MVVCGCPSDRVPFGASREESLGQPVESLMPERFRVAHREDRADFATAPPHRPRTRASNSHAKQLQASLHRHARRHNRPLVEQERASL